MKIILSCFLVGSIVFVACDRKPFVEHKVSFEKINDNCSAVSGSFKLIANFGGERYEFDKCLPLSIAKDQVTAVRRGDTVLINFPKPGNATPAGAYKVILDIDSYPKYSFVTIDDMTYEVAISGN